MSHLCTICGCGTSIPDDKLMCFAHWKLVPPSLQRTVSSAWSAVRLSRIAHKRHDAIARYRAARQAAIDRVNQLGPLT